MASSLKFVNFGTGYRPIQKKPVLSNRALTKQVRALKGQEGNRQQETDILATGVTLTAGTPRLDKVDSIENNSMLHSIVYNLKFLCTAANGATVRLLFVTNENPDSGDLVADDVFITSTDSASPYNLDNCAERSMATHKNRKVDYRVHVYKDMLFALNAGEPKAFRVRINYHGRRVRRQDNDSAHNFEPVVVALADEANVTYSATPQIIDTELTT